VTAAGALRAGAAAGVDWEPVGGPAEDSRGGHDERAEPTERHPSARL